MNKYWQIEEECEVFLNLINVSYINLFHKVYNYTYCIGSINNGLIRLYLIIYNNIKKMLEWNDYHYNNTVSVDCKYTVLKSAFLLRQFTDAPSLSTHCCRPQGYIIPSLSLSSAESLAWVSTLVCLLA